MIKNDKQLSVTKEQALKFEQSIANLESEKSRISETIYMLQRKTLEGQLRSLRNEIEEYEALKEGRLFISNSLEIHEIYQLLIKGRIALGLSQEELGEKIGTTQQQIQRYESSNYESSSLARISEVIQALGLPIKIEKMCSFRQSFELPDELTNEKLNSEQRRLREKGNIFFA